MRVRPAWEQETRRLRFDLHFGHGLRRDFRWTTKRGTGRLAPSMITRPAKDQEARQRAARRLGHNRPGVTSCDLGRSPAAVAAERQPAIDAVTDPKA